MSEKKTNVEYAAAQSLYLMLYCVLNTFAGVFLLDKGYSNTAIGLILAAGNAIALVAQPLTAAFADRSQSITLIGLISGFLCGLAALLCGLTLLPPGSAGMTALYILLLCGLMVLQPLVNAFAFFLERMGVPIQFGVARGLGSLAFAVICCATGVLTERAGVGILPALGLGLIAAALVLMRLIAAQRRRALRDDPALAAAAEALSARRTTGAEAPSILRNRPFLLLLAGTVLIFYAHSFIGNFNIQIMNSVGGSVADMGLLQTFAAVMELPAMLLFDRFYRRIRCSRMLRFSAVFFAVKAFLVSCAASIPAFYAAMAFQCVSFALFIPASVRYANDTLSPGQMNRGQALLTAMISAGAILASLTGGWLIDRFGMRVSLLTGTAVALLGAAVIAVGLRDGPGVSRPGGRTR